MRILSNLLYTIFIPVMPLGIHIIINLFTNVPIKLEYIYPELFFATISICIDLMRILDNKIENIDSKKVVLFILRTILIYSVVSYACIIFSNNFPSSKLNTLVISIASFISFLCSIILCIGIVRQGD